MEWGSSWECPNFPPQVETPESSDPLLPASGHSRSLERAIAGKERGWRSLERQPGQG